MSERLFVRNRVVQIPNFDAKPNPEPNTIRAAPRKTEFDIFGGKEETRGPTRNVQIVNRKGKCGLSAILPEG